VRSGTQLRNTIGLSRIGDEISLTLDRRGGEHIVGVKVEQATTASAVRQQPQSQPQQRQQRQR